MQNEDDKSYLYRQEGFFFFELQNEGDSSYFLGQIRFLFQHAQWRLLQLFLQARRIVEWRQHYLFLQENKIPFSACSMKVTTAISKGKKGFSFSKLQNEDDSSYFCGHIWSLFQAFRMKMTTALSTGKKDSSFSDCRMKTTAASLAGKWEFFFFQPAERRW